MSKKEKEKVTAALEQPPEQAQAVVSLAPPSEEAKPPRAVVGARGLKGTALSDVITLLTQVNPKRPGCAAEKRFALYRTGMTQEEFLDIGGTTPDLAYDTAHGFIKVEGYTPPKMFEGKPRAPRKTKEPKAPKKTKKEAATPEEVVANEEAKKELESMTTEEVVD